MSLGELSEHRTYWADEIKIDRYRRALAQVVTPESVVLDLGCGTGLLGLIAVELGARHVFAVDGGAIIALAEQIALANGAADRITYIRGYSATIDLPEQVDIIVADQIGGLAYEPGVFAYYADARRRFLKPNGVCIPHGFRFLLAPVTSTELDTEVEFWRSRRGGFDISAALSYATNSVHSPQLSVDELLAAPLVAGERASWIDEPFTLDATFVIERSGRMQAIAGMFDALMGDGLHMSNNPAGPDHMQHRWNSVYPLSEPVDVEAGDVVVAHLDVSPEDERVSWRVAVGVDGRARQQSTFFGSFLTPDDLQRTARSYVPSLGAKGELWRAGLDLIEAGRSVAEIEAELSARFPAQLRASISARQFVNQLVAAVDG